MEKIEIVSRGAASRVVKHITLGKSVIESTALSPETNVLFKLKNRSMVLPVYLFEGGTLLDVHAWVMEHLDWFSSLLCRPVSCIEELLPGVEVQSEEALMGRIYHWDKQEHCWYIYAITQGWA